MKLCFILLSLITIVFIACSEEQPLEPTPPKVDLVEEAKLIPWNILDGKIAYAKNGTILLIDCELKTIKILRENGFSWLAWNNDKQIITGCLTGGPQGTTLYGIDLNGNEVLRLNSLSISYSWSMDGRLAYNKGIYLSIDGVIFTNLLPTTEYYNSTRLAWSINDQFIILSILTFDTEVGYTKFYKYNVPDSTLSDFLIVNYNPNTSRKVLSHPVYSPDGSKMAYVETSISYAPYTYENHLYIIDSDGTNKQKLTSGFDDEYPAWSPDNNKLLFTRYENSKSIGVFLFDLVSYEIVQILPEGGYDTIWFN